MKDPKVYPTPALPQSIFTLYNLHIYIYNQILNTNIFINAVISDASTKRLFPGYFHISNVLFALFRSPNSRQTSMSNTYRITIIELFLRDQLIILIVHHSNPVYLDIISYAARHCTQRYTNLGCSQLIQYS